MSSRRLRDFKTPIDHYLGQAILIGITIHGAFKFLLWLFHELF